ncbi:uncharacterized protein [Argopecten irradians]|uniref:uncharacterized protein n=1 Tax=Argopecten irradians TaxID=31199 RepID=UPI003719B30B
MTRQLTKDDVEYLRQFYYTLDNPAAFSGPRKLYKALKGSYSYGQIKQFLQNEDAYSLQKPVRHKYRRQRVIVTHIDEECQADLLDVRNLAKHNDKIQYLLVVIDIFSKFLWIQPLSDKKSKSIVEALKKIFADGRIPEKFYSDKGSEFENRWVKGYLDSQNVRFFTSQNTEVKSPHKIRRRSYQEQWTTELFKISQRFRQQGIPMYTVKDFQDKSIEGTFYQSELQKVQKEEDELWKISKVLKKRKRNGKIEYLVQFEGWPKQFNQYVPEEEIKTLD